MQILANGQCSMWESVRQVASLLNFERPRHKNMVEQAQAYSFTVGVYARQQLVGLAKETLTHSNVCRLFCSYTEHLCPSFCWTTLAVHLNYEAPVHKDPANGPHQNLLTLISSTEKGGIWIQCPEGRDFQEVQGRMCGGSFYQLQDQYMIFPAHQLWHASQTWDQLDRYTIVAYTVRNWAHLQPSMQDTLKRLGFRLPASPDPSFPWRPAFPTVLLDPLI